MIRMISAHFRDLFQASPVNPGADSVAHLSSEFPSKPILVSVVVMMAMLAMACGGGPDIALARGRSIEIQAGKPVVTTKMSFLDDEGRHRVIRPKASNRQLAMVELTVVNRTSTVMPLLIDGDAAQLGDRRGERIGATDPFEGSRIVEEADADEGKFAPLVWGEIQLDRDFQVKGWMVFDVPKGLTLGSIFWNEIEDIIADYINYFDRG
ncbi:MAG: hypothetical protein QF898_19225 [SAR202 cluster bacterium]|jgi:hypothetical protein|nr:hypothetical protein [SAR202 cluster bacterium]MDP6512972.1 hypothetical protein [SAR202 cluster bacterium]